MNAPYDLMVIGAGMEGITAANRCAAHGWRVGIVDPLPYGGTCALRGCDPKKILRRGAEVIDDARLLQGRGVDATGLALDWSGLMRHKRGFTDGVPDDVEARLRKNGVRTFHGGARFVSADALQIDGESFAANRFLIATGARPRSLEFPGREHMIDSTEFLSLPDLPPRILFVGGGLVSFEFAHIAARAGADCVIVHHGERPLRAFDPDLVDLLVRRSEQVGIHVHNRSSIGAVSRSATGLQVDIHRGDVVTGIETDLLVHGAGRVPDLDTLDLEAADVASGPRGVDVFGHLQSRSNPRVFAAGDSADTPGERLTPVAVFEGKVAASNMIKGSRTVPVYSGVPSTVFTIPELNRVGMLEEDAARDGRDVDVRFHDTSGWYSNYRVGETTAATKVIIDPATDQILGAHLLGPGYSEVINTFALAIKLSLTTRQLKSATATYPSVGSDVGSML